MYTVELDRSKRLLVISAAQRVTAEQAKQAAQQVRELLQDVAPGLRVLADFRWLESMDSGTARHVANMMDALTAKQVASVTRVISDPHKDIGLRYLTQNVLDERARRQESFRPAVAGLRSGKHSLHADFISCHPADDHTFCNPKLNKHMKKSVLSLITVLIGIAFIASCAPQQGGTTATSTTAAATKSPSPSPTHKKRATTKKKKA